MRAVVVGRFGGPEELSVREVAEPHAGSGQVRVRVRAAGLNPVDYKIFAGGDTATRFAVSPPFGNGNDYSGVVDEVGAGVDGVALGDAVYGGARFHAQSDWLIVEDLTTLNPLPPGLGMLESSTLDIAGRTAVASVAAVGLRHGETVFVSAAAGGVGVFTAQLARLAGATVVGTASTGNHAFLRSIGVIPVAYGPGLIDRLRAAAPAGFDAALDNHGLSSIETAIRLGVRRERINTVADKRAGELLSVQTRGRAATPTTAVRELADLVASGKVVAPIDSVFPLDDVTAAYARLIGGHVRGKVVLDVSLDRAVVEPAATPPTASSAAAKGA
jgi:NADPH:quinone reductase-like Zn-dependent oxidoreductase